MGDAGFFKGTSADQVRKLVPRFKAEYVDLRQEFFPLYTIGQPLF